MIKESSKLLELFSKAQKRNLIIIVIMMIIFSLLEMVSLGMLIPIFSNILSTENQTNIFLISFFSSIFAGLDKSKLLQILFISFFFLFLFKFLFSFWRRWYSFSISCTRRAWLYISYRKCSSKIMLRIT